MELLSHSLKKYILEKETSILHYIKKLYLSQTESIPSYLDYKGSKNDKYLYGLIITTVSQDYIYNLCLFHFLVVYTYQNSIDDKNYILLPVSIVIGKKLLINF